MRVNESSHGSRLGLGRECRIGLVQQEALDWMGRASMLKGMRESISVEVNDFGYAIVYTHLLLCDVYSI